MGDPNDLDPNPGFSNGGAVDSGADDAPPATGDTGRAAVPDRLSWLPYAVGIGLLIGYAVFVLALADRVNTPKEIEWARLQYLFNGVEALAFAAAGFFFGREVNRGRAEAAEVRAASETKRAAGAQRTAATANARGQVISEQLQKLADGAGGAGPAAFSVAPTDEAREQQLQALARTAQRWFPRS